MTPGNDSGNFPSMLLDPTKWVEPEETFIGKLVICERSDTDQSKTKDGDTFTEFLKLPRPMRQWRVVIERLDAVFVSSVDQAESPIKRYMTCNLERYDDQKHTWTGVNKGNNKSYFTLEAWAKQHIALEPDPAKNVGMVAEWKYLRSKMFGGGTPAKDILIPVKVLAMPGKDYAFPGEVEKIEFTPKDDAGAGSTNMDQMASDMAASAPAAAPVPQLDDDATRALLAAEGIDGADQDKVNEFMAAHKAELPSATKVALATGEFKFS